MKTARIDVTLADAKGLGVEETVTLVLTGKIRGLETYDMTGMAPVCVGDKSEGKKEPPKITVNLDIESVKVERVKKEVTPKKAFDEAYEREGKAKEE